MDCFRSRGSWHSRRSHLVGLGFIALCFATSAGCIGQMLATGVYLAQGGNLIPAEYDGLEDARVVIVCRPPMSHEYRHAGASQAIGRRISALLAEHVDGIDVVDSREVDNWADESDFNEFKELGRAVGADKLVHVDLADFSLYKGRTLYQGNADVTVSVYDMVDGERLVWERSLGEVLYPRHSGIPAQDKPVSQFQREFQEVVASAVALHFYKHDPHSAFAIDALANR